MLKGFCTIFICAGASLVASNLAAQVYRCETDAGVVFSDMPCGESAQQIEVKGDVVDMKGVGGSTAPFPAADSGASAGDLASQPEQDSPQTLDQFLDVLGAQRDQQIGLIDEQIRQLQDQLSGRELSELDPDQQAAFEEQLRSLETNRSSILSEYEALIREAASREN